jgi:regulatory protein
MTASDDDRERSEMTSSFDRALSAAYGHLSRRDRTVAEIRAHLVKKEVEESIVDAVVEELVEQKYLDDARFAQRFAEDRRLLDGWGADRIERKLRDHGVEREHISAALAGFDHGTELDSAIEVLRRRHREPPADDRERERALGFLVRKGYDLEVAYDAVRALARSEAA